MEIAQSDNSSTYYFNKTFSNNIKCIKIQYHDACNSTFRFASKSVNLKQSTFTLLFSSISSTFTSKWFATMTKVMTTKD